MSTATYYVEIGWVGGSAFTGASDDVSSHVRSLQWTRGRDYASMLVGRSIASKLTLELDNRGGTYNSFLSSSPIAGSIIPGRRIRVRGRDNDGEFPYTFPFHFADAREDLYYGFISSITSNPKLRGVDTVTVEAWGPLGFVNRKEARIPMLTSIKPGSAIGTILDKVGWGTQSTDRDLDEGQTTISRIWTSEQQVVSALRIVEATESGFLLETKAGAIKFEGRHARYASPHTTSQDTYEDTGTGTLTFSHVPQRDPLESVYNEMEVSIRTFTTGTSTVLWTHPESGTSAPYISDGEARIFWANYPNPVSAQNAVAADSWVTPAATTDYVANENAAGTGTVYTAALAVTVTKFARSMKIRLENTGTTTAYLTKLQARGVAVTELDQGLISESDDDSQTVYGERTYRNPSIFLPDSQTGRDWALYNLNIYKDPTPILEITVPANKSQYQLSSVFERDLSDRVTISATGSSGLGIHEDFFLESEAHSIDSRRTHTVTYRLSPVADFQAYWVMGISELGITTRTAY